jgi:hypothetical protein
MLGWLEGVMGICLGRPENLLFEGGWLLEWFGWQACGRSDSRSALQHAVSHGQRAVILFVVGAGRG